MRPYEKIIANRRRAFNGGRCFHRETRFFPPQARFDGGGAFAEGHVFFHHRRDSTVAVLSQRDALFPAAGAIRRRRPLSQRDALFSAAGAHSMAAAAFAEGHVFSTAGAIRWRRVLSRRARFFLPQTRFDGGGYFRGGARFFCRRRDLMAAGAFAEGRVFSRCRHDSTAAGAFAEDASVFTGENVFVRNDG